MADNFIDLTGSTPPPSPPPPALSRPLRSSRITRTRRTRRPRRATNGCPFDQQVASFNCDLCRIANSHRSQPYGSNLNQSSIPAHELFLRGLTEYWRRRLNKIFSNINQTPPQVQSYVIGHQPLAYSQVYATTIASDPMNGNQNLMVAPNYEPQPTLPLFPEEACLFSVSSAEEGNGNNTLALMAASDEGVLDLELRLG